MFSRQWCFGLAYVRSITITRVLSTAIISAGIVGAASAIAQEVVVTEEDFADQRVYSPYAGRAYADQVFFGDTHFHTELSFDAGLIGTTLDVHDGFRMARVLPSLDYIKPIPRKYLSRVRKTVPFFLCASRLC